MKREVRWITLALLSALAQPGFAESMRAPEGSQMKAQASLDFRIVIPETVHMHSSEDRSGRAPRFISQTTEVRADRIVVTVAKP